MVASEFSLAPALESDTHNLGAFRLCSLLLMNDQQYPWFILVPRLPGVREICELERDDLISYQIESNLVAKMIIALFKPDKLNIAALGNMVPQLHIHHIGRFVSDPAWPKPVWGQKPAIPYDLDHVNELREKVKAHLGSVFKV